MRVLASCVGVVSLLWLPSGSAGGAEGGPAPEGPYLGQEAPRLVPEVFAPGIVSTSANELNCAFSPDGKELVFTERRQGRNTLMIMKQRDGHWTERSVAPFSGEHGDVDPYFSSDGTRLYFSSSRPLERGGEAKDADLWFVERREDGEWGRPVHVEALSLPGKDDYYTSMTLDGALYFSRFEMHGAPGDIYRSRLTPGGFASPERVAGSVSTEANEHDPFVAPDGSYLIFTSDRPGGHGRGDLYVAFRRPDGGWGEAKNMGEPINSEAYEYCPMLSPDGRYLFFTRNPGGNGDVYWVATNVVERLREPARQPQRPTDPK